MTDKPHAMPELPEPELGYIETDKSRQPAFSARQMREALQSAQPAAAVSDEEIRRLGRHGAWRYKYSSDPAHSSTYKFNDACLLQFARAILALRPQAVPMTEEQIVHAGQLCALTQRPAAQTEREADGLPPIVAGAIFDFAGFMTTRAEVIEVGSTAEAGPVADLVKEWAELRGLDLADAAVLSWRLHITRASLPAPQQATPDQFADASKMVALRSVHLTRDTAGMCVVRINGRVAIRDNGDLIDHTATLEWFADTQQATPEPVGFVLVPVEPTPEMLKAMESQWLVGSQVDMAKREYAAMLAAAQAKGGVHE